MGRFARVGAHGSTKQKRHTQTQTKLGIEDRKRNVARAFEVNPLKEVEGKVCIVVDDVITTGATITACGEALLNHGASSVLAASAALAE